MKTEGSERHFEAFLFGITARGHPGVRTVGGFKQSFQEVSFSDTSRFPVYPADLTSFEADRGGVRLAARRAEVAPALCFIKGPAHNCQVARVRVGTSGFSYKEWKGLFYPEELPDKQMLPFYATRFPAVEIDSTFYRIPSAKTLESWRDSTPADFRFVLKAPQQITHRQRLQVPSEALNYLMSLMPLLGDSLGLVSYQLPPFFKCDPVRLQAFLEMLPPNIPTGFEFRHPSWFIREVYDLLRSHRASLCVHDSDEGCSPFEITASIVHVRLRRERYSDPEREEWRGRLRDWANSGIEVFAFIKHKDNPDAPRIAQVFAEGF